jgi:hypothetical protein
MTTKAIREKVDRAFELSEQAKEFSALKDELKAYGKDHDLPAIDGDVGRVTFKDGTSTNVFEDRLFGLITENIKKKLTKAELADLEDILFATMAPSVTKIRKASKDFEFNLYHYIEEEKKPYNAAYFSRLQAQEPANKPVKLETGRRRRKRR